MTKELTYEEFVGRKNKLGLPVYNNFVAHWDDNGFHGMIIRQAEYVKRFAAEHPQIDEGLRNLMKDRNSSSKDGMKGFERQLYVAYLLLKKFNPDSKQLLA